MIAILFRFNIRFWLAKRTFKPQAGFDITVESMITIVFGGVLANVLIASRRIPNGKVEQAIGAAPVTEQVNPRGRRGKRHPVL